MCAVERGRGATGEGGEGVGCCEEEGGAEAVVGVALRWIGHFCHYFCGDGLGLAERFLGWMVSGNVQVLAGGKMGSGDLGHFCSERVFKFQLFVLRYVFCVSNVAVSSGRR